MTLHEMATYLWLLYDWTKKKRGIFIISILAFEPIHYKKAVNPLENLRTLYALTVETSQSQWPTLKQTLIYSSFGFYQDHTFQLLLNWEQMIDTINLSGKCLLRSWCHRCLLYNQISFWNQSCCHLLADLRQSCSFTFVEAALISNTVFSGQMCIFNCRFLYQTQFYTSSAIMTKKGL